VSELEYGMYFRSVLVLFNWEKGDFLVYYLAISEKNSIFAQQKGKKIGEKPNPFVLSPQTENFQTSI
jgi:hypothetical protein